jgi:heme/copper-type cytochrome/quinol oxidase subunit 2
MKTFITILLLLFYSILSAQQPTHVPGPQTNSPIDLNNWFDIIVFIILPLVMIFFYFMWRRQVKMDKKKENN